MHQDGEADAAGARIPVRIAFEQSYLVLQRSGRIDVLDSTPGAPRADGHTIGVWETQAPAPHGGERHSDGDELLFVLEGAIELEFDCGKERQRMRVDAGEGCLAPQDLWHRVIPLGRCRLLHLTPGPRIESRPPGPETS